MVSSFARLVYLLHKMTFPHRKMLTQQSNSTDVSISYFAYTQNIQFGLIIHTSYPVSKSVCVSVWRERERGVIHKPICGRGNSLMTN